MDNFKPDTELQDMLSNDEVIYLYLFVLQYPFSACFLFYHSHMMISSGHMDCYSEKMTD